jgi:hypothetical protein
VFNGSRIFSGKLKSRAKRRGLKTSRLSYKRASTSILISRKWLLTARLLI